MENGHNSLRQAQDDVEEVKIIMLDNLDKANERSGKLRELENRAVELKQKGEIFSKTSAKVKQKKRWENYKYKVIIAAVISVVVIGIIVAIIMAQGQETKIESGSP
ncbi:vesicle-associated membrane protein 5 [Triplophysa dalaica]|uniref:vesicle-associated membrane protein 5 n=1 Tax=Triplophysa dalaica TaxID=1582913 RepID=UPI0024DFD5E0|nr:vesicle-associated membrane protein 5 [Triplophysa dalaica]